MIEMLGVLAIIGVLSVGGIAGYSKAMMQYRINKTVDQISQIVGNVRTMYSSQKNYYGLDSITIWKKGHLVPDEMWNTNKTGLENAFGGDVWMAGEPKRTFHMKISGLPEEACMALATYDWGSGSSSGLISVNVNTGTSANGGCNGGSYYSGAYACPNGASVAVPMPVNIAATACQENDNNHIFLKFK